MKKLPVKDIKEIEDDIKKWSLRTSLKKADQAIDYEKSHISSEHIRRSGTDDYKKYFEQIKKNFESVLKIVGENPAKKAKKAKKRKLVN